MTDTSTAVSPAEIIYPLATSDGYSFENKEDEEMRIETFRYENGGVTKKAKLSDGRIAKCRRLKGKDQKTIQRLVENEKDKVSGFQNALIAMATTIDDKPIVMEDLDLLWYNDYTVVMSMSTSINF